jgi:hypothetical protein
MKIESLDKIETVRVMRHKKKRKGEGRVPLFLIRLADVTQVRSRERCCRHEACTGEEKNAKAMYEGMGGNEFTSSSELVVLSSSRDDSFGIKEMLFLWQNNSRRIYFSIFQL